MGCGCLLKPRYQCGYEKTNMKNIQKFERDPDPIDSVHVSQFRVSVPKKKRSLTINGRLLSGFGPFFLHSLFSSFLFVILPFRFSVPQKKTTSYWLSDYPSLNLYPAYISFDSPSSISVFIPKKNLDQNFQYFFAAFKRNILGDFLDKKKNNKR